MLSWRIHRMDMFSKIKKYIFNPDYRFIIQANRGKYNDMPDEEYLKRRYKALMGRELNLENPLYFSEKLQWLKLYDRNPLYTTMVDKYAAKQYVAKIIGDQYIIPTIGVWDRFDDIDFSSLPNQFVLKCTHDSGGLVICRNKENFNKRLAKKKIERCLKQNYYWRGREWPYKDVKPRIIAEQYMEDEKTHELRDYKIFEFNDIARALFLVTDPDKNKTAKCNFFDTDFKHLSSTFGYSDTTSSPADPKSFDEMIRLAAAFSKGLPNLHTEFYEVNNKAYFGEITFSHKKGNAPGMTDKHSFESNEWKMIPSEYGGGYCLVKDGIVLWFHEIVQGLVDYKFFCMNGTAQLLYISKGLEHHPTAEISFYDLNGNELPFHRNDYKPFHNAIMPSNLTNMITIANQLAKETESPFVRIDLYAINKRIYFSEITFSPCSGMIPFEPQTADSILGESLSLFSM